MKKQFTKPFQAAIIILVVAGLVMLALGGYFGSATNWASRLIVDAQGWVAIRFQAISDFLSSPRDMSTLRQRNLELEAEVSELQGKIIELQQQLTQTEILSALVDFARTNPENVYKAATIIGQDPSPFLRYVIINVGSSEGIMRGMPVVTQQGLIGRVDAVVSEAARIKLITDQSSAVNVRLKNSKTDAILAGSVTGDLTLGMISNEVDVILNDLVITSGLGGDFPANIIIGQVMTVSNREYELFQNATVQPVVDFSKVEFVLVITNFQPVDISPLITNP